MQLENVTAQVRPRPAWEAVDLGFMMLQKRYRPAILSWLVITLPIFIAINVYFYSSPVLAALCFWWLLPIFDRIPLHILSRALFGEVVTTRSLLRNWTSVLLPNIIKSLTIYRLDFARSYNLPVWQLEKLKGKARAERARVLKKMHYSSAVGLSFMCLMMEVIVFISLFGLVMMFMPEFYADQMAETMFKGRDVWWVGPLLNVFFYLSLLIIEPFYVAGGFSLYINRRTELEGWDIEIVFRQLAERIKGVAKAAVLVLTCLGGMQLLPALPPNAVLAQEQTQQNVSVQTAISNDEAKQAIEEIMASDEFGHKKKVSGWYRKQKPDEKEEKKEEKDDSEGFNLFGLNLLGNTLALAAQILIWIVVAALVVAAVYFFIKWMPSANGGKTRRNKKQLQKSLFGLEITPESLPEDVGTSALKLWKSGKVIEALSLLYRAALTTLVHRDGINLRGSATEGDCLRILAQHAEKVAQPTREFFKLLTRQWQYAAYAHRRPDDKVMTQLCQTWGQHFGEHK